MIISVFSFSQKDTTIWLKGGKKIMGNYKSDHCSGEWIGYDTINQQKFKIQFYQRIKVNDDLIKSHKDKQYIRNISQFGTLEYLTNENDSVVYEFELVNNDILKNGFFKTINLINKNKTFSNYQNNKLKYNTLTFKGDNLSTIKFINSDSIEKTLILSSTTGFFNRITSYKTNRLKFGNQINFYPNGEIQSIYNVNDRMITNFISYHENGQKYMKGNFSNIKFAFHYFPETNEEGYYFINENGITKNKVDNKILNQNYSKNELSIGEYFLKDGMWIYFDENGKFIKREFFDNGKLKKSYFKHFLYFLLREE